MSLPKIFGQNDPENLKEACRLLEMEFPQYKVLTVLLAREEVADGENVAAVQLLGFRKDKRWPPFLRSLADSLELEIQS